MLGQEDLDALAYVYVVDAPAEVSDVMDPVDDVILFKLRHEDGLVGSRYNSRSLEQFLLELRYVDLKFFCSLQENKHSKKCKRGGIEDLAFEKIF